MFFSADIGAKCSMSYRMSVSGISVSPLHTKNSKSRITVKTCLILMWPGVLFGGGTAVSRKE
jgi:hypothetical protein